MLKDWLSIHEEAPKEYYFGVNRNTTAFRMSKGYKPPKKTLLERLKAAWKAFNEI
jgi:hypothetical protein